MEEENIYTHVEDTMSNIYLNGNMLNSGTVMVMLEEKDQRIKELEQQLAIYKRALELACKDRCHRCYSMVTGTCQYDPKTYDCKSEQMFLDQAKKELEEQK